MGKKNDPEENGSPDILIFTDLDGTLLDHVTYEWKEALPALNRCKESHIPVILVSSKTRAEIDLLRRKLSLSAPFISENGGGIFFPDNTFEEPPQGAFFDRGFWIFSLGIPYVQLVKGIAEIREELGWDIKGFSDMSSHEISRLTGLDEETSKLAAQREYDEPFVIPEDRFAEDAVLIEAAARRGLTVTRGGRFYHLHGDNDKGRSMEKVISWYKQVHGEVMTIVLGDSPNDFPMLKLADYPILVRGNRDFLYLKEDIPRLEITRAIGPEGWNSAVLGILDNKVGA
jgi:mannosyl-3-phosphoglycerate phosphatase